MTTDDDCYNHGIYNSQSQPVEGATRSFNMTVDLHYYICIILKIFFGTWHCVLHTYCMKPH